MRSLLSWFNRRRRLIALALLGLTSVVVVSAGRTPQAGDEFRVPDLSGVFMLALGLLAVMGLIVLVLARPKAGSTSRGEVRSIRAVLIFTIIVVTAAVLFGPPEVAEEPPVVVTQETESDVPISGATEADSGVSGTDIAALALLLIIIAAVVLRNWRQTPPVGSASLTDDALPLREELAPALVQAHRHLREETDPRTAVLLAYASLERALTTRGWERVAAETPSEHIARTLADIPVLATPAVRLGALYEVARFSDATITESERRGATLALDRALDSLASLEPSQL